MSDEATAPPEPGSEMIPAAQVVRFVGWRIAKDNSTVMMRFELVDGSHFGMVMPVGVIGMFLSFVQRVRSAVTRKNIGAMVALTKPDNFAIGDDPRIRGNVLITMGADTEDEASFIFADGDGLNMANAIERNILGRMPLPDRERYAKTAKPIIPAHTGRIILPRGGR